jgi:hypothetical protein
MDEFGNDLLEGPDIDFVIRIGMKGNIDGEPFAFTFSYLIFKTRTWEEGGTRFMERDGENLIRMVERCLNSIPMVGIDIDIGYPHAPI